MHTPVLAALLQHFRAACGPAAVAARGFLAVGHMRTAAAVPAAAVATAAAAGGPGESWQQRATGQLHGFTLLRSKQTATFVPVAGRGCNHHRGCHCLLLLAGISILMALLLSFSQLRLSQPPECPPTQSGRLRSSCRV